MTTKTPWLPAKVPAGASPERCPQCGRRGFLPWTLRRDIRTKQVIRTWICVECQRTQERPEPQ